MAMKVFIGVAAWFAFIVAASTRRYTKKQICRYCRSEIDGKAVVCCRCGRRVEPKTDVGAMMVTFLITFAVTFGILLFVAL